MERCLLKLDSKLVSSVVGINCNGCVNDDTARATDNAASAGDLQLHLDICDVINETDSG